MKTGIMGKYNVRSAFLFFHLLLFGLVFSACSPETEIVLTEPESLAGFIVLKENTLYVDEVEIITTEDKERIAELDLTDGDMPNGYYIHNPSTETVSFALQDDTTYTFTDFHLLFVEDPDGDRVYTTTNKDHFIQHLHTSYSDEPPAGNVPFFLEVKDGKVISITEKLIFTQ